MAAALAAMSTRLRADDGEVRFGLTPVFLDNDAMVIGGASANTSAVPEPSTWLLAAIGLAMMAAHRRNNERL